MSEYYRQKGSVRDWFKLRVDKQGGIDIFLDQIWHTFDLDVLDQYFSSDDPDYENYRLPSPNKGSKKHS